MMSTLKVSAINNAAAGSGGLAIDASGVVTGGGLDFITSSAFTTASTVSVDGCFTADYDNYKIVMDADCSAAGLMQFRMRASSTDATASQYYFASPRFSPSAGTLGSYAFGNPGATFQTSETLATITWHGQLDVYGPAFAEQTSLSIFASPSANYGFSGWCRHSVATAYDGFTIYPSAGTITGTVRIYGYRN